MATAVQAAHRAGAPTRGRRSADAVGGLRRVLGALQWVVAAVGLVCVLLTVAAVVLGLTPLVVQSGSMAPGIPTGSVVLAREVPAAELSVGDVAGLDRGADGVLLHRVVSLDTAPALGPDARVLVTRGDANEDDDAPATVTTALRPVAVVTGTGDVVTFARGRWVLFWTGVVAGTVVTTLLDAGRRRLLRET